MSREIAMLRKIAIEHLSAIFNVDPLPSHRQSYFGRTISRVVFVLRRENERAPEVTDVRRRLVKRASVVAEV